VESVNPSELAEGNVVAGRYRIRQLLGAGGMGVVWTAEHLQLGRLVALKVMLSSASASDEMRNRFVNEARAAAAIGHPNIVDVFDLGFHDNCAFIAMEKLEGEELERRINRSGPLPVEDAIRIGIELAEAIGAAHERGIIHRDLKPANVFLATRGRHRDVVKVLDFGIAKLAQSSTDVQTKTGAVFGSPLYMAPEQLRDAKSVDSLADVYALGGILYAMLAGHPPFDAPTLQQLFYDIVSSPPVPLRTERPEVPQWLDDVVLACLEKRPSDRPASGRTLVELLESRGTGQVAPQPQPEIPAAEPRNQNSVGNSAAALTPLYSTAPAIVARRSGIGIALAAAALSAGAMALVVIGVGVARQAPASASSSEWAEPKPAASVAVMPVPSASILPSMFASVAAADASPPPTAVLTAPKPAAPMQTRAAPPAPPPVREPKPVAPPPLLPR
jgi:eukaryotic-like serine/threonine-protein kinase